MSWRKGPKIDRRRWAAVRRRVLDAAGWACAQCGRHGRMEVDHVVPLSQDPAQDPYDPAGLQVLCRAHHLAKSLAERGQAPSPDRLAWRQFVADTFGTP